MHAIVRGAPGYFGRRGPFPSEDGGWEHSNQSARACYRALDRLWRTDEQSGLDAELMHVAHADAHRLRPRVEAEFVPPRFTQANFHAIQFFVHRTPSGWVTNGVVDMEVALGGWPLCDVPGIVADLSHPRLGGYRWWWPWFESYGEPDFDLFRLVLLTIGQSWWNVVAPHSWGTAPREGVRRHILSSRSWGELLHISTLA